jgi:hypothetical protein
VECAFKAQNQPRIWCVSTGVVGLYFELDLSTRVSYESPWKLEHDFQSFGGSFCDALANEQLGWKQLQITLALYYLKQTLLCLWEAADDGCSEHV